MVVDVAQLKSSNNNIKCYCRVTVCNPSLEELGYEPNERNTINL